jgi:thymidylate synthase
LYRGQVRSDRTGTGTYSKFGEQLSFSLQNGQIPLLTTKFVSLKTVFDELMWFIRADTNVKTLHEKRVKIWDGNVSKTAKQNLVNRGIVDPVVLDYPDTVAGPIYGFAWRCYGGNYVHTNIAMFLKEWTIWPEHVRCLIQQYVCDESDYGVDQLEELIDGLKRDPYSRRHILLGWNPSWLRQVVLPPCHMMAQFYVKGDGVDSPRKLSCLVYMRSNDLFLGAPFNIASYALLTHMLAKMTNMEADTLHYHIGDAHVYKDHINQARQLLLRPLRTCPTLEILHIPEHIDLWEYDDMRLHNYHPHPALHARMSV